MVLALAAGCAPPPTALHVVVESSLRTPADFGVLALEVFRPGSPDVLRAEALSGDQLSAPPYRFNLLSGPSTPPGTALLVRAAALQGTRRVAEVSAVETLVAGEVRTLVLALGALPLDGGGTSDAGSPDAGSPDAGNPPAGSPDAGSPDSGRPDAGAPDAGAPDAGARDAGAPDAGAPDAGLACTTDPPCGAGRYCHAVNRICVDQQPKGASCGAGNECLTGFCADGVCCDSACGGACDACNAAGMAGTCLLSPPGAPGSPSCGLYTCPGNTASCATTCGGGLTCASGITCNAPTCTPKISTLKDDFADNALDSGKWTAWSDGAGAVATETNGRLEVRLTSSPLYAGFRSVARYDLTGSSASVQLAAVGNQGLATLETVLFLVADGTHHISIIVGAGTVLAEVRTGLNTYSQYGTRTYSATNTKYLRIREAGGTIFWETSADNVTWSAFGTRLVSNLGFPVTNLRVEPAAGTYDVEPGLSTSLSSFEAMNP